MQATICGKCVPLCMCNLGAFGCILLSVCGGQRCSQVIFCKSKSNLKVFQLKSKSSIKSFTSQKCHRLVSLFRLLSIWHSYLLCCHFRGRKTYNSDIYTDSEVLQRHNRPSLNRLCKRGYCVTHYSHISLPPLSALLSVIRELCEI